jgi:hypothetical protein
MKKSSRGLVTSTLPTFAACDPGAHLVELGRTFQPAGDVSVLSDRNRVIKTLRICVVGSGRTAWSGVPETRTAVNRRIVRAASLCAYRCPSDLTQ